MDKNDTLRMSRVIRAHSDTSNEHSEFANSCVCEILAKPNRQDKYRQKKQASVNGWPSKRQCASDIGTPDTSSLGFFLWLYFYFF
jgi:hypothetical protein